MCLYTHRANCSGDRAARSRERSSLCFGRPPCVSREFEGSVLNPSDPLRIRTYTRVPLHAVRMATASCSSPTHHLGAQQAGSPLLHARGKSGQAIRLSQRASIGTRCLTRRGCSLLPKNLALNLFGQNVHLPRKPGEKLALSSIERRLADELVLGDHALQLLEMDQHVSQRSPPPND